MGSSTQQLGNHNNYINRPMVNVTELIKKWGDEYIIISNPSKLASDVEYVGKNFIGVFGIDKKCRKYLKLFKEIDIPIESPDYYIITMNVSGDKINKVTNFIKYDENSRSCILSCAYHKNGYNDFTTQLIMVVRDGDQVIIDGSTYEFDENSLKFD